MEALRAAADGDKCYICLSLFDKQSVASLENCQHIFCLECILQWSQTANTCPVDRISFSIIHHRQRLGGSIKKKIKVSTVRKDNNDDEEEDAGDAVICEACGRCDRRHQLLVCTHCESGFHADCVTPSINTHPEGDWSCPDCVSDLHCIDSSAVEVEISDGELDDLLAEAEADETASTRSRLRPSTRNPPSASTERRRSARTGSRSSSSQNLHARASRHVPKYLLQASRPLAATDKKEGSPYSDSINRKRGRRKRIKQS